MATGLFRIKSDAERYGDAGVRFGRERPYGHIYTLRCLLLKRFIDLSITIPVALLITPLLALIAVAIKIDTPGPALFRQRRFGRNFKPFVILKFRSLRAGAPDPCANYEMSRMDPRITRVGNWLRRTSFDELPQIFNVIAGSMSLVGPRPLIQDESYACLARHSDRFLVRPGITGLQQVEARNAVGLAKRSDLDVAYVRSWSLWLDFLILLKTPLRVLRGSAIYHDKDGSLNVPPTR